VSTSSSAVAPETRSGLGNPWVQLVIGIVCMAMIANLQYGWTVFVTPIQDKQGWSLAAIQVSFTVFVLVETWLVPFEAAFVDKYGPRVMVAIGGVLAGLAWIVDSLATTLPMLVFSATRLGVTPEIYALATVIVVGVGAGLAVVAGLTQRR